MDAGLVYGCLTPHPPILVPSVAGACLEQVRATRNAMLRVAGDIRKLSPDDVVLVSPHAPLNAYSMTVGVAKSYLGDLESFGAPSVRISAPGDPLLAYAIEAECRALGVPVARTGRTEETHRLDHGATVPLSFLQEGGVSCPLVLAAFSPLGVEAHLRFGMAIASAARLAGRRVALVASGDLSHRLLPGSEIGFSPRGREFDDFVVSALRRGDFQGILELDEGLLNEAGECGYRSLVIALGAMPDARAEVLSYEGPFGVGYLVARFQREGLETPLDWVTEEPTALPCLTREERDALRLAMLSVESYVRDGRRLPVPPKLEGLLAQRAGVFVSLKTGGELRGCIGTFRPVESSVAAEIVRNAVASATEDSRFPPVTREELPLLEYSIDVLSNPEPVTDISQLDPRRYGLIVEAGPRRGLLLPDLEGVTTVEEQVNIARRKAGIAPREAVRFFRFTVRRIRDPRSPQAV